MSAKSKKTERRRQLKLKAGLPEGHQHRANKKAPAQHLALSKRRCLSQATTCPPEDPPPARRRKQRISDAIEKAMLEAGYE